MYSKRFLFLAVLALAACGDDDTSNDPIDAGARPDVAVGPTCTCLALGSDFAGETGAAYGFLLPSLEYWEEVAESAIGGDPVVRYLDGRFYIINRFGAQVNMTVLDPADWQVKGQFQPGTSSNPQDVAIAGDKAYVVTLSEPTVKVFDLANPATAPTTIDLPLSKADADGNPDASSIVVIGTRAYVALEHLEPGEGGFLIPAADGQIVVIDTATDEVVSTIDLPEQNPLNLMRVVGSDIYLGAVPDPFGATNGCLVRVTTAEPATAACVKTAAELGGSVFGIAPAADGSLYIAVGASFTEGKVVRLDADGVLDATAYTPAAQKPTDLAVCGKWLVTNDGADLGTVHVFDTETRTELTTGGGINVGEPAVFASGLSCFED